MNVDETLKHIEDLGKQRAAKNCDIADEHRESTDTFPYDGINIHNPWESSCGRFEVDPYITYGRSFVKWLLAPFYPSRED